MALIKGKGVIWSCGTLTFAGGIVAGATDMFPQSVNYARTADKVEVKDNQGVIRAQIFSGFKKTATITVIPAGSSIANARTAGVSLTPQAGTSVIVTDDSGTILPATYNVVNARQGRTVDQVATVEMELETSDEGVDITTLVA